MSRLRISHVVVQAVLVWDDGEELTAGPELQPVAIPISRVDEFTSSLPAEVAKLQEQLEESGRTTR